MREQICIYCKHWHTSKAKHETTPSEIHTGSGLVLYVSSDKIFAMWCKKHHWELDPFQDDEHAIRNYLLKAASCWDFSPVFKRSSDHLAQEILDEYEKSKKDETSE